MNLYEERMERTSHMSIPSGAPVSFARKRFIWTLALQLIFYSVSVGLLAFFAQEMMWKSFSITLAISAGLLIVMKILESRPALEFFRQIEASEFDLSRRLNEFGILKVYNMQDQNQQDERNADTRITIARGNTLNLVANSAASYIDPGIERHWVPVHKKLSEGVQFRIVILDPFSDDKRIRDELNVGGEAVDSKFRFDLLCSLHNDFENVVIRVVSHGVYCTIFFTEQEMYFDPYHLSVVGNRITNRFLCLKLQKKQVSGDMLSHYDLLLLHFNTLWDQGVGFQEYYRTNKDRIREIAPNAPSLTKRPSH